MFSPELFDTAFIVLRKKPLIFLHWYHHITVLLYCWHAYAVRASSGLYFIAMNYSVHAIMYFYYFAMAVNIWPKWLNPIFITFFQVCTHRSRFLRRCFVSRNVLCNRCRPLLSR
jgi:hypothetical protein